MATDVRIFATTAPEDSTRFVVPQSLLTESSGFFQSERRDKWASSCTPATTLPGVEARVFSSYLLWVYRKKVAVASDCDPTAKEWPRQICSNLFKLWLLADRLEDYRL